MDVQVVYSSELVKTSPIYPHNNTKCASVYYYKAVEINVVKTDYYTIISNSTMGIYSSLHKSDFCIFDLHKNMIVENHSNRRNSGFRTFVYLQENTKYSFVVTSFDLSMTGSFSVHVLGPYNISLSCIGKCLDLFSLKPVKNG